MSVIEKHIGETIAAFIPGPKGQIKIKGVLLKADDRFLEIGATEKGILGSKTKTAVLSIHSITGFCREE